MARLLIVDDSRRCYLRVKAAGLGGGSNPGGVVHLHLHPALFGLNLAVSATIPATMRRTPRHQNLSVTELTKATRATSLECPIQADQVDQDREHQWHWVERMASLMSLGCGVVTAYAWSLPFSPCAAF